jgi:membrane protease YdiL (CAAX protease family)
MFELDPARRARLRWVFCGRDGLRAGWSLLIFLALIAPLDVLLGFLTRRFPSRFAGEVSPGNSLLMAALQLIYIAGAIAIACRIEGRSVWSYCRLAAHRLIARLCVGWIGGLGCLSLVVGVLYGAGFLSFDGLALHGWSIPGFGLAWLLVFLLVACSEELMFRGYLQASLARGLGFWPAGILVSALFAAGHIPNAGETAVGVIGVMARALVYCFLLRRTGSLWVGIGFHGAWDWAQSYLYGTPQSGHVMAGHLLGAHPVGQALLSGGAVGPEGSLLWAPPFALGMVVVFWTLARAGLSQGAASTRP